MRLLRLCIEAASATIQIVGVGSSGWGDRDRVIFALVAGLANKKGRSEDRPFETTKAPEGTPPAVARV
jgi:hypothetical protein